MIILQKISAFRNIALVLVALIMLSACGNSRVSGNTAIDYAYSQSGVIIPDLSFRETANPNPTFYDRAR